MERVVFLVDNDRIAAGAAAFVGSWKELLACAVDKSRTLRKAG